MSLPVWYYVFYFQGLHDVTSCLAPCSFQGVSASSRSGVSAPRRGLLCGGVVPREGSGPNHTPPMYRMADASDNITFLAVGNK